MERLLSVVKDTWQVGLLDSEATI